MIEKRKISTGMKILSVILGAAIGGFMWRCRGSGGFGSSWGLFSVGMMLTLLIFAIYGKRKNMSYELIPMGALLMGAGVTGYATVIEQMTGLLYSDLPYEGSEPVLSPVNPYSGMVIILIMGFTLVPLFSFYVGTLFSKKQYRIYHYLIAVGIFFAVSYLLRATVSHFIMNLINPDQVGWAAKGLAYKGFDLTPMQAYLKHFGQRKWFQEIPFAENYYMSIESISNVFGSIAVMLYARIAFKDRVTPIVSAIINIFTSVGTTVCTVIMNVGTNSGLYEGLKAPSWGRSWGLWEYATGFCVGFITMLVIALLPNKNTQDDGVAEPYQFPNKTLNFLYNWAATAFVFGTVIFRFIGIRFCRIFENQGLIEDGDPAGEIACAVASVIFAVLLIFPVRKRILKGNGTLLNITPQHFALNMLPVYITLAMVAYFVLDDAEIVFFPYSQFTSFSKAFEIITHNEGYVIVALMVITFILIMAIYLPIRSRLLKKKIKSANA